MGGGPELFQTANVTIPPQPDPTLPQKRTPNNNVAAPGGARWFHQHFGVSKEPLRLMAWFGPHNPGREPGPPGEKHIDYTGMDINEGGSSIPYWMEDPYIAKQYVEMLEKNGAVNRMDPQFYDKNYKGELPKE